MFRILVASSASCCASINSLNSPARSPQLPPVDPATERAAAKLVGREDMFIFLGSVLGGVVKYLLRT